MPLPPVLLRPLLRAWRRLRVEGARHLAAPGPLICAVRRTGALDPLVLSALLPRRGVVFPQIDRALLDALRAGAAVAIDAADPRAPWLFANAGAAIVAVHIDGLELCRWSAAPGGTPRRLAPRVGVAVGQPLPLALAARGRARRNEAALAVADRLEELRRAALDRHPSIPAALADAAAAMGPTAPPSPAPRARPSRSAASRSLTPSPAPSTSRPASAPACSSPPHPASSSSLSRSGAPA